MSDDTLRRAFGRYVELLGVVNNLNGDGRCTSKAVPPLSWIDGRLTHRATIHFAGLDPPIVLSRRKWSVSIATV